MTEPNRASLARFSVDSIIDDPRLLRQVVGEFGAERVLCGSDRPLDMGDPDPVGTVGGAGLARADEAAVLGGNPLRLIARATGSAQEGRRRLRKSVAGYSRKVMWR